MNSRLKHNSDFWNVPYKCISECLSNIQQRNFYQSFIYSPTDALVSCLKNNITIYMKF